VVRADDPQAVPVEQRDAGEHLLAEDRVVPEHPPLAARERARLAEHAVGDPDLPDVVEEEAVLDARVVQERRP
jgi:hypothetical protein